MKTLKFHKTKGKTDRVEFLENGQEVVVIHNPKQGIIPHDMVHYIIETCFPFEGFIQLVFKGYEPGKVMEVLGGFAPQLQSEYPEKSWITESLVESLQAAIWSESSSFDDFEYAYQKACEARKIYAEKIQRSQFEESLKLARELTHQWQSLNEGQAVELRFERSISD